MPLHSLENLEIRKYYQNEPKFNGAYSRNYLPKIKDGAYVINLDEHGSIESHWKTLYVIAKNLTYFDSFIVEHILKKILNSLEIKILQPIFIEYKHIIQ